MNLVEEEFYLDDDPSGNSPIGLPTIIARGRQLPDVTRDVLNALGAANVPPVVFARGGAAVRLRADETGRLSIAPMNEAALRGRMARVARFIAMGKEDAEKDIAPPLDVVRDLAALDLHEVELSDGSRPFVPLEAVTTIPVFRPDGTIIDKPGYDPPTRLFYAPTPGLNVPTIPARPTREHAAAAIGVINEAIEEFPYADEPDWANAIGTLVTPAIRQAIEGKSPLAIFDAPQAGTGKSLLADVTSYILTGASPAMMGAPADDNEWRKQITATLLTGPTIIVIDNIDAPLTSGSLARALTATVWSDRILGASDQRSIIQRATWIATGNNVELGGDLPRRCYRVRLDAKTSRPWRGREFTHPDLLGWVAENRGRLVAAILTLCRAWHVAGRPLPPRMPVIGSFEEWCRTVGGILHNAGIRGFLGNLENLYEEADDGGREWESFLQTWHDRYGADEVELKQMVEDLQADDGTALRESLPEGLGAFVVFQPPRYMDAGRFVIKEAGRFKIRLGKQLRQRIGRRFGAEGLHLSRREDSHKKSAVWRVEAAGSAVSGGSATTLNADEIADFHMRDRGPHSRNSPHPPQTNGEHLPERLEVSE